jgi:glyoxylase-like metal-dependent hydrolase (beta-lactamase superfamily II)
MGIATATQMWALDGPTLTMDKALLMVGQASEQVTTPCPAFLIEHPRGLVMFDTGLAPEAAGDPVAYYGQHLVDFTGMKYEEHQRIDRQLEGLDVDPTDVKFVVLSHGHFDHTGGVHLFTDAKIIMGAGEMANARWPRPSHVGLYVQSELEKFDSSRVYEVPTDFDLFGDGSIVVLQTPGHTPGELSLMVRLPSRTIILTADAVHIREQLVFTEAMNAGLDVNADEAIRSIKKIQLYAALNDAEVWVGHDPGDWAKFGGAQLYV